MEVQLVCDRLQGIGERRVGRDGAPRPLEGRQCGNRQCLRRDRRWGCGGWNNRRRWRRNGRQRRRNRRRRHCAHDPGRRRAPNNWPNRRPEDDVRRRRRQLREEHVLCREIPGDWIVRRDVERERPRRAMAIDPDHAIAAADALRLIGIQERSGHNQRRGWQAQRRRRQRPNMDAWWQVGVAGAVDRFGDEGP